ncbi:MAG: hypothetical protein AABX29_08600 [Nanoarchaeota archaeon]
MVKDKPSSPKNKYAKSLNFSSFTEKPIVKNGYVVALLVFIGLVVAFNLASSYDNSVGNQVTGMASSASSLSSSLGKITELLKTFTDFIFGGILKETVLGAFLTNNDVIIRLLIFIVIFTIISLLRLPKAISVIVALLPAVFVPQEAIGSIFSSGGLFSGILGLIMWTAFIFLPLLGLFKWLKDTQSKIISLFLAVVGFLGWLFVITAVEGSVYVTPNFTDLWDMFVGFGSVACIFGAFWGFWKGATVGKKSVREEGNRAMEEFITKGGVPAVGKDLKRQFLGLFGRGGAPATPATKDKRELYAAVKDYDNITKKAGKKVSWIGLIAYLKGKLGIKSEKDILVVYGISSGEWAKIRKSIGLP